MEHYSMVIILYQFNYNIEKTQWTDQTSCETKNKNKIISSITNW